MPLLAVVVGIAVIGGMSSTLAGTITLNSGSTVEFGQGIVTAAACDSSVTITPSASYESDRDRYQPQQTETVDRRYFRRR